MDVVPLGLEGFGVKNTNLEKAFLPDWRTQAQFLSCPKSEAALHKLNCAFDRHSGTDREKKMEMVGHHNECLERKSSCSAILINSLDEQAGGTIRLQKTPATRGS